MREERQAGGWPHRRLTNKPVKVQRYVWGRKSLGSGRSLRSLRPSIKTRFLFRGTASFAAKRESTPSERFLTTLLLKQKKCSRTAFRFRKLLIDTWCRTNSRISPSTPGGSPSARPSRSSMPSGRGSSGRSGLNQAFSPPCLKAMPPQLTRITSHAQTQDEALLPPPQRHPPRRTLP